MRFLSLVVVFAAAGVAVGADPSKPISYYRDIRPILQANCQGCHQPAISKGGYVMTVFDRLLAGGDSGTKAVDGDKSEMIARVKALPGHDVMPPGNAKKLTGDEIALLEKWITQGASDDTPTNAKAKFDLEHPPVYTRPPVVPSLDISPDGQFIAVAGFHEVLLHKADGSGIAARLIGLSERIESVRFSPDGKRLAVAGGLPGRMGEIQVWDIEKAKLKLSLPVTADTVYGVSWSPDGKLISFGCAEGNTVRAIEADTGKQVLYQGAHSDWALDTVFSADGSHLVSVGRDRACKLIEVATQRFVDNITSITPGALKGGILSVARHPLRDEVVVGGADGHPKIYRMHRQTARVIGDDANLIRQLPALQGRVWSVAVSRDGKRIVAGSSLDARGEVGVYANEIDNAQTDRFKAINTKAAANRTPAEIKEFEAYQKDGIKQLAKQAVPSGIYAVAFMPDGKYFVAAGSDGMLRLFETENAKPLKEWPVAPAITSAAATETAKLIHRDEPLDPESPPANVSIASLDVTPKTITLANRYEYAQIVVTGKTATGERIDLTRQAKFTMPDGVAEVTAQGLVRPVADGQGPMVVAFGGTKIDVPISVSNIAAAYHPDFVRDVNPILSRSGCNAGTCHGSKDGKNGFKLSLRGYDPIYDIRAFTDDHASRRTSVASPDDSLMLMKSTGAVPHVGGQLTRPGEAYYTLIRDWIADGAKLNPKSAKAIKLEISPTNPIVERIGDRQQFRLIASYADGTSRDVTREAIVDSGNIEVVRADKLGLTTTLRRGEAPVLARYEGNYAATTLTVMGDRTGFTIKEPAKFSKIDDFTAAKWARLKIEPSDVCSDADFLRRVTLDLTGLPPSADTVRAFTADMRDNRIKRDELIDRLVGSPEYIEHWTNKWADLLQVNRKYLGTEGSSQLRQWIRMQVSDNVPYDRLTANILTASGSNKVNPPAGYYKVLRQPTETMENTTHLFLAVRFNCNKCHDHPFERWTQDQYYETSAFFAQFELKKDPAGGAKTIGGSAVEGATPLYEEVSDRKTGDVLHDRTGAVTPPKFPYPATFVSKPDSSRREQLAAWMTAPDNQYFAKSYVNRAWGYMFGVGIIEPIDDIRAGNPASNPELLDYLTDEFVKSGFNTRHIHRLIAKSRTYQLSVATNKWNEDDKANYSHALARRLSAEVIFDAVHKATGSMSKIPGLPAGARAAELPDSGVELPGGFLSTLGRPPRESACECERTHSLQLGPVMALVSGQVINDAIADPSNAIAKLVGTETDDAKLINEMFMRILNRPATPAEIKTSQEIVGGVDTDHTKITARLADKEKDFAPIYVKLQEDRDDAINRARQTLDQYKQEQIPIRAKMEHDRLAALETAKAKLAEYDAVADVQQQVWETQHAVQPEWIVLAPKSMKASMKSELKVEKDGSIFASGPNGAGNYTLTFETDLRGITGMRLEVLADDRLPARGPGRAPNGNFVISELDVTAAAVATPKDVRKLKLLKPLADFSQDSLPIAGVLDGKAVASNDGWAVSPRFGTDHWATFEFAEPVGGEGGTILTVKIDQKYSDKTHSIGRFRLSFTTATGTVGLSLPHHVVKAIQSDINKERTITQANLLADYFRRTDAARTPLVTSVENYNRPLAPDAKLMQLQTALAATEKPVPIDPKLLQLRADAKLSAEQLKAKRLTAAQDLAWALVNSPAFLFNR